MSTATITGTDQTRTRPVVRAICMKRLSLRSSSAIAVPSTIVSVTFTAVKRTVRSSTVQNWESWRMCA
jgi:hypothetical protein